MSLAIHTRVLANAPACVANRSVVCLLFLPYVTVAPRLPHSKAISLYRKEEEREGEEKRGEYKGGFIERERKKKKEKVRLSENFSLKGLLFSKKFRIFAEQNKK